MTEPAVLLRALEPEDLDELYAIENDRSVWSVGRTNVPYSRYTLHEYIANQQSDIYVDNQVRLVVENLERQTVGLVDLSNFSPRHQRAEMGIIIKQAFRRQGYGRAAVRAMLDYARDILYLHQVYAIVQADNREAVQLFSLSGFEEQVNLSDWLYDGHDYTDALLMQCFLQKKNAIKF